MKQIKLLTLVAIAAAVAFTSGAAGFWGAGVPQVAVNSTLGGASTALATNGLYSSSIAAATTETNLVPINANADLTDKDIVVQYTACGTTASTTNTAVFVVSSSVAVVGITNNAATGVAQSTGLPRASFDTVTLTLNGTTPVTTNKVYSPSSTTIPFSNGLRLYLESVAGNTGSASLTNYSVQSLQ